MLCIFRIPAASRPLIGMRACCTILHYCPRPRYPIKWFSQSSQRPARRNDYTPEQLAAFTNYYAILGLSNNATNEDIKKAYNSLCKRFHPDMMRNVDSKEYWNNPDRPEFVNIKNAKETLLDPAKRKAYDATYDDILQAVRRLVEERKSARGVDAKRTIASHLRLDQPTTFDDGSPIRDHCVVQVIGLPPQVTVVDLVRAIAQLSPVGRVIGAKLMKPNNISPDRAAHIEFANDGQAQLFGLLALHNRYHVLRKEVWHCKLIAADQGQSRAPPPEATRVLVIDGPRNHKLMTVSSLGEYFGLKLDTFDRINDSSTMMESTKGPNLVTIEWVFTTWRKGAKFAFAALRREYPELSVSYGRDPCE